jgi:large subunit ribosomal protein L10e
MGLRPAKCYRKIERPYTRKSKTKLKKNYVKGVPSIKIRKFEIGNPKKNFPLTYALFVKDSVQIRHNALEAVRIALNKILERELGKENYFVKILIYPHHVLRENVLATGAGADRFQTGMRLAYGKVIGTAAQVKKDQKIIEVRADKGKEKVLKKALKVASSKIPVPCRIMPVQT